MQWQIFYLPVTLKALFTKYIYFSVTLGGRLFHYVGREFEVENFRQNDYMSNVLKKNG